MATGNTYGAEMRVSLNNTDRVFVAFIEAVSEATARKALIERERVAVKAANPRWSTLSVEILAISRVLP